MVAKLNLHQRKRHSLPELRLRAERSRGPTVVSTTEGGHGWPASTHRPARRGCAGWFDGVLARTVDLECQPAAATATPSSPTRHWRRGSAPSTASRQGSANSCRKAARPQGCGDCRGHARRGSPAPLPRTTTTRTSSRTTSTRRTMTQPRRPPVRALARSWGFVAQGASRRSPLAGNRPQPLGGRGSDRLRARRVPQAPGEARRAARPGVLGGARPSRPRPPRRCDRARRAGRDDEDLVMRHAFHAMGTEVQRISTQRRPLTRSRRSRGRVSSPRGSALPLPADLRAHPLNEEGELAVDPDLLAVDAASRRAS